MITEHYNLNRKSYVHIVLFNSRIYKSMGGPNIPNVYKLHYKTQFTALHGRSSSNFLHTPNKTPQVQCVCVIMTTYTKSHIESSCGAKLNEPVLVVQVRSTMVHDWQSTDAARSMKLSNPSSPRRSLSIAQISKSKALQEAWSHTTGRGDGSTHALPQS